MPEEKIGELWLLYCLYGTDVQGVIMLMDVLCPRDSKAGTGAAVKCHPQATRQPLLSLPVL